MGHGTCIVKDRTLVDRANPEGSQHGSEARAVSAAHRLGQTAGAAYRALTIARDGVCVYLVLTPPTPSLLSK